MAGPRLPFLWPILFRSAEAQTPATRSARAAARFRAYHATPRRKQQETVPQRYGSANEPPPHLGGGKSFGPLVTQPQVEQAKLPKIGERLQQSGEEEVEEERVEATVASKQHDEPTTPTTVDSDIATYAGSDTKLDAAKSSATEDLLSQPSPSDARSVESLLDSIPGPAMPKDFTEPQARPEQNPEDPPLDHTTDEHSPPMKAPHLDQPRYVHHFDTYGLVKQLTSSGWSATHATLVMKAVRMMLADNMELAKDALVSKSMVENETYLFRAACAELKTEHEVDILSQRVGQESGVLKDDLKGMFDDRKMGVRNEQRGMESKIQQLNYKITVSLQADARSEVEGLRWVMTRRVIITLAAIVVMVIGGLRLAANALHERELEAKKKANQRSGGTQTTEERRGTSDFGGGTGTGVGDGGRQGRGMGGGEVMIKGSEDAAFVSLG
ncbi:hypothetical protein LTS09_011340 [Friedmanniomyces endolithicus]|nr:hypothetical protein LTS09_011340 [Friedmanniomyces endolithicus]